jgi:phage terminase large subunit
MLKSNQLEYLIAQQHLPIREALNLKEFQVILVIGERSTGKSTDAAGVVALGLLNNIENYLKTKLQTNPEFYSIAIMRQNYGSIKNSIWKSFFNRVNQLKKLSPIQNHTVLLETQINGKETGQVWAFCKGFKTSTSSDTASSKGLEKVNIYLIDEAEEISKKDYDQLLFTAVRERAKVILICNTPHKSHWIVKEFLDLVPTEYEGYFDFKAKPLNNFTLVRSRMSDNPFLLEESKVIYRECGNIESSSYNLERYCRDVLGLVTSNTKGQIFNNYTTISNQGFDEVVATSRWGLDFGFSNDPTALIEVKEVNGCLYLKQWIYELGLTNMALIKKLDQLGIDKTTKIIADNGGLGNMLIQELKDQGWNIHASIKGAGSVKAGILKIQEYKVFIAESSQDVLYEFNNYSYELDSNREATSEPRDEDNHAVDAVRYALNKINQKQIKLKLKSYAAL